MVFAWLLFRDGTGNCGKGYFKVGVEIGPQLMTADQRKSFIHFVLLEHRGVNFKPKTPSSFMPRKEKKNY